MFSDWSFSIDILHLLLGVHKSDKIGISKSRNPLVWPRGNERYVHALVVSTMSPPHFDRI